MSALNGSIPRPVPRRSHSTLLPQAQDNVTMNAEICRYRKALKERGKAAPDPTPSSNVRPSGADSTANDNDDHNAVIDSWRKQLQDVIDKNTQWQVYDSQRETYVKSLHKKYHDLYLRYQELNNTHHRITSNPSMLADEQRQYYDKLLIQARQERESHQQEIARLKAEVDSMRVEVNEKIEVSINEAKHWKLLYEKEFEKHSAKGSIPRNYRKEVNANKENWDRISSLQRQMEMQREDFSLEQSKRKSLERQLENLQKQLKSQGIAGKKSSGPQLSRMPIKELRSKSKSMKCSDKPPTPPKLSKLCKEEKQAIQNDRRSHPIKLSNVTIRKASSTGRRVDECMDKLNQTYGEFGSHDDSNLSCPNCGKIYAVDQHEFLLAHIDLCL